MSGSLSAWASLPRPGPRPWSRRTSYRTSGMLAYIYFYVLPFARIGIEILNLDPTQNIKRVAKQWYVFEYFFRGYSILVNNGVFFSEGSFKTIWSLTLNTSLKCYNACTFLINISFMIHFMHFMGKIKILYINWSLSPYLG